MKQLLIITTVLFINMFAMSSVLAESSMSRLEKIIATNGLIEDDNNICGSVERNSFKDLVANLKKQHNTTLEESYFRIKCDGKGVLRMVIDNPADRYFVGRGLRKYFERKIKQPEFFSKILLHKVNGRDILSRIDYTLKDIKGTDLESIYNKKLYIMKKKYTAHLKQYPVR